MAGAEESDFLEAIQAARALGIQEIIQVAAQAIQAATQVVRGLAIQAAARV